MSRAQRAFGLATVLVVSISLLQVWLFESLVVGEVPRAQFTTLERIFRPLMSFSLRHLPLLVVLCVLVQAAVLGLWTLRPPKAGSDAECGNARKRLSVWLRLSLLVTAVAAAAVVAATIAHFRLTILLLSLVPLFAWAYTACMYRALQVQAFREAAKLSRISPSWLATAAILPLLALVLWPVGLAIPGWVLRSGGEA